MTGANDALGAVQLASSAADGTPANGDSVFAAFSADGTKVLFNSEANNLAPGAGAGIYIKNLITGALRHMGGGSAYFFTSDGNSVVFSKFNSVQTANSIDEINLASGAVTTLSTNAAGAQANGFSGAADLSPDGRRLLFGSTCDNLVGGDTNASLDWFIKDLARPAGHARRRAQVGDLGWPHHNCGAFRRSDTLLSGSHQGRGAGSRRSQLRPVAVARSRRAGPSRRSRQ